MKIFLVGDVASGKSSLLNAIAGGIVSSPYNQKEINSPIIYEFDKIDDAISPLHKITPVLNLGHQKNKKVTIINDPKPITDGINKIIFKSLFGLGKFTIYDFYGIHNPSDSLLDSIGDNLWYCDLLVFVTSADNAFLHRQEMQTFMQIRHLCQSHAVRLCIVVNKFDLEFDFNHNQIVKQIPSTLSQNIFRISSHKLLIENILKHKLTVPVADQFLSEFLKIHSNAGITMVKNEFLSYSDINPNQTYNGDWDDFIGFLLKQNNNLLENRKVAHSNMLKYYCASSGKHNYDIFSKLIIIFIENDNVEILIQQIIDSLFDKSYHRTNYVSLCIKLADTFKNNSDLIHRLSRKFNDKTLEYYRNYRYFPSYICSLFFFILSYSTQSIDVELLLGFLKQKNLWRPYEEIYWDIRCNVEYDIGNNSHSKFRSLFVNNILVYNNFSYQSQPVTNEIHQLVNLSLMFPAELGKLDQEKKLPYIIIKKYLGDLALIRTKLYIKNGCLGTVPYLFNDDIHDNINSKNLEYTKAKNNLLTIYKLLRFNDEY